MVNDAWHYFLPCVDSFFCVSSFLIDVLIHYLFVPVYACMHVKILYFYQDSTIPPEKCIAPFSGLHEAKNCVTTTKTCTSFF